MTQDETHIMSKSILKSAYNNVVSGFQANGANVISQLPTDGETATYIAKWLANLKLLHNVPFRYLVPDERMLPMESIRFFHVDVNWLNALIDGAYSIGRYATGLGSETLYNKVEGALGDSLHAGVNAAARDIRPALFNEAATNNPAPFEVVTGFLLRSQVVAGWKSLQASAYTQANYPALDKTMHMLRFERLSDEVLFGMFEGEIYRLDLHEPSEGIHFGFDTALNADQLAKKLRNTLDGTSLGQNSIQAGDLSSAQVFRPYGFNQGEDPSETNKGGQVVNLYNMSALLYSQLNKANAGPGYQEPVASVMVDGNPKPVSNLPDSLSPLASSDFALQMVEGVGMVSFYNDATRCS